MTETASSAPAPARRSANPQSPTAPDPLRRAPGLLSGMRQWLALAVALGVVVRAVPVVTHDFPLNDGGLFYVMARELAQAHFSLPLFTHYDAERIPFAYAPFGLYVAAVLSTVTPMSLFAVLRWIPLVVACLMVPAFIRLARDLLPSPRAVLAATVAFALLPRSWVWLIMGGGITRVFGMLFTILALDQAYRLYTRRERRYVLTTGALTALTILSHLGTAPFAVVSIVVLWIAFGRTWRGTLDSVLAGLVTVAVTAPWWLVMLSRYGLAPFAAAAATGGSVLGGVDARWSIRLLIARWGLGLTGEPLFPVILLLAIVGTVVMLTRRRYLLPAWWLVIVLADVRATGTYTSLPIAMLAGLGVTEALLPLLWTRSNPSAGSWRRAHAWPVIVLGVLVLYGMAAVLVREYDYLPNHLVWLTSLDANDRAAMHWVARHTPATSRVLVVSGSGWTTDRTAEWFPVLAERPSVGTVQGTEWLPDSLFAHRAKEHAKLDVCSRGDATCLAAWSDSSHLSFTHVYVSRTLGTTGLLRAACCRSLIASLSADSDYVRVYDGPGAAIFAVATPRGSAARPTMSMRPSGSAGSGSGAPAVHRGAGEITPARSSPRSPPGAPRVAQHGRARPGQAARSHPPS